MILNTRHLGLLVLCIKMAFESESLESKFYNSYCEKFKKTVDLISNESSYYRIIGEIVDSPDVCKCNNPSGFVLYTAFAGFKSPVTCFDCNKLFPLYKLPKINNEDEYNTLLYWEEQFKACDRLFMQSNVGEVFGYKQMSSPKSKLTVLGREICSLYEGKTQKPFYYFLYKYGKQKSDCPICHKVWSHMGNQEIVYCENCKLLAHI